MKYVYYVSYFWAGEPDQFTMGGAEVVMSAPITEFDDIVAIGEISAARTGAESVVVLNWKLLRMEAEEDGGKG